MLMTGFSSLEHTCSLWVFGSCDDEIVDKIETPVTKINDSPDMSFAEACNIVSGQMELCIVQDVKIPSLVEFINSDLGIYNLVIMIKQ